MKLTFVRFPNPTVPVPAGAGARCHIGLPYWNLNKGMKLTFTGVSDARNDPAQALPQRLLDPVGVWNNLGHGHPADLGVVITQGR